MWVGIWYVIFCLDQVYIKHIVDTVKMDSNWGRVYYSNLLPCFPLAVGYYAEHEVLVSFVCSPFATFDDFHLTFSELHHCQHRCFGAVLLLGCWYELLRFLGMRGRYFVRKHLLVIHNICVHLLFKARSLVSATYFTIIGNVCKILTIIINVSIWDKHATPQGIVCLLVSSDSISQQWHNIVTTWRSQVCLTGTYFYEQVIDLIWKLH